MKRSIPILMNSSRKDLSVKMGRSQATRCLRSSVGVVGLGEHIFLLLALRYKLRVSVGRHLGDAAVWIAITSFLATFSVHKALDEHGEEVPVVPKFSSGIAMFVDFLPYHS